MSKNNEIISDIGRNDAALRDTLREVKEGLEEMNGFNKLSRLSYSLDIAQSKVKTQENKLNLLKRENEALKTENQMLRTNLEHLSKH